MLSHKVVMMLIPDLIYTAPLFQKAQGHIHFGISHETLQCLHRKISQYLSCKTLISNLEMNIFSYRLTGWQINGQNYRSVEVEKITLHIINVEIYILML